MSTFLAIWLLIAGPGVAVLAVLLCFQQFRYWLANALLKLAGEKTDDWR